MPAIASTFGVKPESAVFGALFGKSDWSSTATTCGPAPIAKSVSVAVGESETMRLGRFVTVDLAVGADDGDRERSRAGSSRRTRRRPRAPERLPPHRRGRATSEAPESSLPRGVLGYEEHDRSSDSGLPPSPPSRLAPVASWRRSNSPYSGGTVPDSHRVPSPCSVIAGEPIIGRCAALSPGTGFPSSPGRASSSRSRPFRISGRGSAAGTSCCGRSPTRPSTRSSARCSCAQPAATGVAFALGVLYAISDEVHQTFVAGRHGAPLDVAIDAVGVAVGIAVWQSVRTRRLA